MDCLEQLLLNEIKDCLSVWCQENKTLFKFKVSEQCFCGSLALKLKEELSEKYPDYYYDVEFNKGYGGGRKIVSFKNGDEIKLDNIICDLVVHNRGEGITSTENLIAIEMKKKSYAYRMPRGEYERKQFKTTRDADIARLCALTSKKFNYEGYDSFILPEGYILYNAPKENEKSEDVETVVNGYQIGVYIELNDKGSEIRDFEAVFFSDGNFEPIESKVFTIENEQYY